MDISKSGILLNLSKSNGSYLFDDKSNEYFLDLMSMYSSLPLGYNHNIFSDESYIKTIIDYSKVKTCNCEYFTEERIKFEEEFVEFTNCGKYDFVHFSSTGAIAVELAIKAAMDVSNKKDGIVVYFEKSFHGILGYSNFITDRVGPTKPRLDNFISYDKWIKVSNSEELEYVIKNNDNISCVIIEPIRCTQGDLYYSNSEIDKIFELCNKNSILSISDEIQTGFGATGKIWYTGNRADIIVFGKKAQVSGFLTTSEIGNQLNPTRYCVTWDGDVLDMIRSRYIMKAIKNENLIENVIDTGLYLKEKLSNIDGLYNIRGEGFIIGFDMDNNEKRDYFYKNCLNNRLLINSTGDKSVRLRPNLCFSKNDVDESIYRISQSL